ncbi:MAG: glycosyltransferase family 4 protein [Flavobacterium sp.]|jgi:glycosyltransferase involved in cell wall biosynthesis|nr:glycosyltransferase family 4 protein [Flavobacterium sp.]|tara:strand:- start:7243 stop:8418 length:1176 start_codon:yes stop_codon:yes gene_type:complete
MTNSKSIVFVNQSSGYLMIDIINAHAPYYDELVLLTGFFNPRGTPLSPKVKIKYLKSYKRSGNLVKFYSWFIFHLQSLFYIFFKYRKSKLYLVSNPPINIFTFAITKREYVYLIYDMYPQVLVKNNLISTSSWLYNYWIYLNKKMFDNAKHVFTLSDGMKENLKYISRPEEVKVVPVWTNTTFFNDIPKAENIFLKTNHLEGKFIVGYSGNLGKTHPVEKIIEIAEYLKNTQDIQFLIIGDGEKKLMLEKIQAQKKLPNLKILDFQATKLFPHVLAAMDIGVVTLEINATDLSVPSKTFDLMSAGKPILSIASNNSELAAIIATNHIGQNFDENASIEQMAAYILKLKSNLDLYEEISENSKRNSLKYTQENAKQMVLRLLPTKSVINKIL